MKEDIALIPISFFLISFPDKMPTIFTSKTHHTTSKSQFGGAIMWTNRKDGWQFNIKINKHLNTKLVSAQTAPLRLFLIPPSGDDGTDGFSTDHDPSEQKDRSITASGLPGTAPNFRLLKCRP